jgi:hypothetical protein
MIVHKKSLKRMVKQSRRQQHRARVKETTRLPTFELIVIGGVIVPHLWWLGTCTAC